MAKNSTKERDKRRSGEVHRITTVDNPRGGPGLFIAALLLVVVAGIAATVFFALNRESNIGVSPVASVDHWHSAYLIHDCGADLPVTGVFDNPSGLHTHGDGLLHLHPFNPSAAGNNATLGEYLAGNGSVLTDDSFTTGFTDVFPTTMSEAEGCDGESATLQLAVWDNAFDETAEPTIITEGLADYRFESAGQALTLALLPEGAEVPKPPQDRIAALAETGPGGPITGVEEGESPFVTTTTEAPPDAEATEDGGAEADGVGAEGDDATTEDEEG